MRKCNQCSRVQKKLRSNCGQKMARLFDSDITERADGGTHGFCESLRTRSFCLIPLSDEESTIIADLLESGMFLFDHSGDERGYDVESLIRSSLSHEFSCGTRDTWFTGFKALKQRQVIMYIIPLQPPRQLDNAPHCRGALSTMGCRRIMFFARYSEELNS